MLWFHPSRFIWGLTRIRSKRMVGSQAQAYCYHDVSLHALVNTADATSALSTDNPSLRRLP